MAPNCSNTVKAINQQIEEAQQIPSTRNLIKVACRHMIKLLKTSDKVLKNNQRFLIQKKNDKANRILLIKNNINPKTMEQYL